MFPPQVSSWRVGCRRRVVLVKIQREEAVNELSKVISPPVVSVGHTAKLEHKRPYSEITTEMRILMKFP